VLSRTFLGVKCYNSSKTAEDTNFKFGRRVPRDSPNMTPDKSFRCGRGQGHVTTTTVPCKLLQWDRYRVPQNVFWLLLLLCCCVQSPYLWLCLQRHVVPDTDVNILLAVQANKGNAFVSINVVAPRRAGLLLGLVTVPMHLDM